MEIRYRHLPRRRKFFRKLNLFYKFRDYDKEKVNQVFEENVNQNEDFQRHLAEVSDKLDLDREIVDTVVKHYFTRILHRLNFKSPGSLRIVIYQFFHLDHINFYKYILTKNSRSIKQLKNGK